MKIIREKATKEVVFAGDDLVLTDNGLQGKDFGASNITKENYEAIEVSDIPKQFIGRSYVYDENGWSTTEYGQKALSKQLERAKTLAKARIDRMRRRKERQGVTVNGFIVGDDQDTMNDLVLFRASAKNTFQIKNTDGDWDSIDQSDAKALLEAVIDSRNSCRLTTQKACEEIDALGTVEDVAAYTIK